MRDSTIFTPEHQQFSDTVRRFFRDEVEPNISTWERAGRFDAALFRKAGEYGILQAGMPVEYGGMGGDFIHHSILHEGHGGSPAGPSLGAGLCTDGSSYMIFAAGTEQQKKDWIPRYASGEVISEGCFTEPHAGSDIRAIRTHARRDGSDYIINGSKMWVTNGSLCTMFLVAAKLDGPGGGEQTGIFMVDAGMPGVTVSREIETVDRGCSAECELFFEDVRVPVDRLVGGPETGAYAMKNILSVINAMRTAQATRFLAAAQLAFDLTVEYVKGRHAFGQPVLTFQNTQFVLADIMTGITVLRPFLDQCLKKALDGSLSIEESAMAKLAASELEFSVADRCVQLHGGMGLAHEMTISRLWASARVHRIFLGTSEMQRATIARGIR